VWARVIALVSLNALHIGAMVPAMYIFFVSRLEGRLEKQVAADGNGPTRATRA
jgi:hypothetical protein